MKNIWRAIFVVAVAVAVITVASITFLSHRYSTAPELAGVKEMTLTPSSIALPPMKWQLEQKQLHIASNYVIRNEADRYVLYFEDNGRSEKVIGEMPSPSNNTRPDIEGPIDVVLPSGTTSYFLYEEWTSVPFSGPDISVADLYAVRGNRSQKILSHVRPAGINSIDRRKALTGYLDRRGNLYVIAQEHILCLIRDGQVLAKVDVSRIGPRPPPRPSMFSDTENTYYIVPPPGSATTSGPLGTNEVEAIYSLALPQEAGGKG